MNNLSKRCALRHTSSLFAIAVLSLVLNGCSSGSGGLSNTPGIDPAVDTFITYGPPGQTATPVVTYNGIAPGWLTVTPGATQFDATGAAIFTIHYEAFASSQARAAAVNSPATISVTSGGTGVIQAIPVTLN